MLEMIALPLGRVDAILLECCGQYGFIDGGNRSAGAKAVAYMNALGIEQLEWLVVTHAHADHCGADARIIAAKRPKKVFISHDLTRKRIIAHANTTAERKAVKAAHYEIKRPGDMIMLGDTRFDVLGPQKVLWATPSMLRENYNSLVMVATTATGGRLLLTGDTSAGILAAIERAAPGALRADVLKNPHHNGALPLEVLCKICPQQVVVCNSAPPGRTYRKRLEGIGAQLLTACPKSKSGQGNVRIKID